MDSNDWLQRRGPIPIIFFLILCLYCSAQQQQQQHRDMNIPLQGTLMLQLRHAAVCHGTHVGHAEEGGNHLESVRAKEALCPAVGRPRDLDPWRAKAPSLLDELLSFVG